MKRAIAFLIVLLVGLAALYFGERRHESTRVSANAVLEVAADVKEADFSPNSRFAACSRWRLPIGNYSRCSNPEHFFSHLLVA